MAYATTEYYATVWMAGETGPAAVASGRELADASLVVDAAVAGSVFDVDAAGAPSDPVVLAAFRDATCAVVQDRKSGTVGGLPGLKAATIGGARYEVEPTKARPEGELPATARQILRAVLPAVQRVVYVSG